MAHYQLRGSVPRKRHTQHRRSDGGLYYEELMGQDGFFSDSSLLYHRYLPSAITDARPWELGSGGSLAVANVPLRARHFKLHELFPGEEWKAADAVTGRRLVLANADVRIGYVACGEPSPLYRDAVGDECCYVEAGSGTVETVFGSIEVGQGDYVVLPRGTTHRWLPAPDGAAGPLRLYCIEASSHITPAHRYLSRFGQFLEHSPYCERDLRLPGDPPAAEGEGVEVYIKHRSAGGPGIAGPGSGPSGIAGPGIAGPGIAGPGIAGTIQVAAHHPFDVVGWDGCLYPYAFNVADFEPITGRVHQPPPVHQVFEGEGFVVCNFVPRKVDYHPQSIPVPYYHSNVDSDEVMFYCGGSYEARSGSGIGLGSVSLHPAGQPHGPQPGAYERSIGVEQVDELAVMVDTFRPLGLGEGGRATDDGVYAWSWAGGSGSTGGGGSGDSGSS